jgi:hypothetical protein
MNLVFKLILARLFNSFVPRVGHFHVHMWAHAHITMQSCTGGLYFYYSTVEMHQSVGNSLRVLQWNPPMGLNDPHALVDAALANPMYTTRASFHSGLQTTPGALAFHRNMVMNIPLMSDLERDSGLIPDHCFRGSKNVTLMIMSYSEAALLITMAHIGPSGMDLERVMFPK